MARRDTPRCYPHQVRIRIRYAAVANANKRRGGFCPVIRVNQGRVQGNTFCGGMDKDRAIHVAKQEAFDEAAKYRGDYCTRIVRSWR